MANGHGGSRPGSGRKVLEATKLREAYIAFAEKNAEKLAAVVGGKALEGDIGAIRELNDRAVGKAPASLDLSSGGKELKINLVSFAVPNEILESPNP